MLINYNLPEFCFLDGNSHQGDSLEERTVLQHIRSYTILEVVALDDMELTHFKSPVHKFTYTNFAGIKKIHALVLHFSLAWEKDLPINETLIEIFEKCTVWYCDYLKWEDDNILLEEKGFNN